MEETWKYLAALGGGPLTEVGELEIKAFASLARILDKPLAMCDVCGRDDVPIRAGSGALEMHYFRTIPGGTLERCGNTDGYHGKGCTCTPPLPYSASCTDAVWSRLTRTPGRR